MYLKTIAELSEDQDPVGIPLISERLGVTPVSTSEMVKRLVEQGFLEHERYRGVVLTEEGRAIAYSVMRRQRLWECFLVDHLNMNWAGAYEMACRLEHATSAVLADALDTFLDHPTVCPHGNPIPGSDGKMALPDKVTLDALTVGQRARIVSIQPTTTDIYVYLQTRNLQPDQILRVVDIAPLQGPMTLEIDGTEIVLGRNLAKLLLVQPRLRDYEA
jgi:DtxR family Mn-dependent transcriptional regulator